MKTNDFKVIHIHKAKVTLSANLFQVDLLQVSCKDLLGSL